MVCSIFLTREIPGNFPIVGPPSPCKNPQNLKVVTVWNPSLKINSKKATRKWVDWTSDFGPEMCLKKRFPRLDWNSMIYWVTRVDGCRCCSIYHLCWGLAKRLQQWIQKVGKGFLTKIVMMHLRCCSVWAGRNIESMYWSKTYAFTLARNMGGNHGLTNINPVCPDPYL